MLRLVIKEYDDEEGAFLPMGSFILRDGVRDIEIDTAPDGVEYMRLILSERVCARDAKGVRGPLVSADEDPAGWMRGVAAEYHSQRLHAALHDDKAPPDESDGTAPGWEEPAIEVQ